MVRLSGLEPPTPTMSRWCSNQAELKAHVVDDTYWLTSVCHLFVRGAVQSTVCIIAAGICFGKKIFKKFLTRSKCWFFCRLLVSNKYYFVFWGLKDGWCREWVTWLWSATNATADVCFVGSACVKQTGRCTGRGSGYCFIWFDWLLTSSLVSVAVRVSSLSSLGGGAYGSGWRL